MGKNPAFQLYTGDWLKDPNLRMCSEATRGIWIDLVCYMHELDRSGKISGSYEQLARICGSTVEQLKTSINELKETKTANVTDRNGLVTIINRRMKREHNGRISGRERVQRHREKTAKKQTSNGEVTAPSSSSITSSSSKNSDPKKDTLVKTKVSTPTKKLIELYHKNCPSLLKVKNYPLSKQSQSSLKQRWKEHPDFDWWIEYFKKIEASDFLAGRGKTDFVAGFHWIIKPANMEKIINEAYKNRSVWDRAL